VSFAHGRAAIGAAILQSFPVSAAGLRSNLCPFGRFESQTDTKEKDMGKAALLWLIGVPIPVILVLWLLFH
jgi:hypothetical protein